jgi:hypothetical protein
MSKKIIPALFAFFIMLTIQPSCVTIYNYDLSILGLDSLPATKACIQKYVPKSVNTYRGEIKREIRIISLELNNYEQKILDSLAADSIYIDTSYILKFSIRALDPNNEVSEIPIEKTYHSN